MNDSSWFLNLNDTSYTVERTGSKLALIFIKIFCQKGIKYNCNICIGKLLQIKITSIISTYSSRLIAFSKTEAFSFTIEYLLLLDIILITQLLLSINYKLASHFPLIHSFRWDKSYIIRIKSVQNC